MFIYKRKAQYHETDKMGIIHHSNYIKWMEEARVEFMDALGHGYRRMEKTGIASPVASLAVEYKNTVEFGDEVEVRLSIAKYSGAALEVEYEFYNTKKGEICTTAHSRHCFIKDGRLVSLKRACPALDAALRAAVG
ncbi:MAG: acyl-CoA thioesterase [Clostridia bacterium]|nr:acyl-CoA thioesterase [Clostridia bacterium]